MSRAPVIVARLIVPLAAMAAAVWAAVALASATGGDDRVVVAEFTSARGLVEGNDVRIDGAPAGTVSELDLSENGTALVTMRLHDGLPELRADATAAIRPVDLIGDTYIALDPGSDAKELEGGFIPRGRTLNAPRLDDLLRVFGDGERAGLEAMLVETGLILDRRGADLNRAALALRPALEATDAALREAGSQNANLREFIASAERVTRQAAGRDDDLARLVEGLDASLARTAEVSDSLDATLERLPVSLPELSSVTSKLDATAAKAVPMAESLRRTAPTIASAAAKAEGFLDRAGRAVKAADPAVRATADLLGDGERTLSALGRAADDVVATAPSLRAFLDVFAKAAPDISEGFFVNFPDQAAEPGTQPGDPFADPRRHYWRGAAVITCQTFGLPIKPGCLMDFLLGGLKSKAKGGGAPDAQGAVSARAPQGGQASSSSTEGPADGQADTAASEPAQDQAAPADPTSPGNPLADLLDLLLGG